MPISKNKTISKSKSPTDPMQAVLANIQKQMGMKDSSPFCRFGDIKRTEVPVVSFGITDVDNASNIGGLPRGKLVEIFGGESSGKSLLSLYLMASAQKQGLECALIDVEQSFDPTWAAQHGVDVDRLVYSNDFESGDQALEYAYRLCESGAFGVVVIDSTAALTPKSELEGTLDQNARIGAQAQMMSRGCRKIVQACGHTNAICVFINQIRMKIGVMFGNPETTPGGRALPFYAHVRIRMQKTGMIKGKENGKDVVVGVKSEIKFIKNKVARPFGTCEFQIIFDPDALNPVVMLANQLRAMKMIAIHSGLYKIEKEVLDNKKRLETGATNMTELANWMIENEQVVPLIQVLVNKYEEEPYLENDFGAIDGKILDMLEDPSKIIAPEGGSKEVFEQRPGAPEEIEATEDIDEPEDANLEDGEIDS